MIEILDDLGILTRPELDLSELSLSGVPYGSRAVDTISPVLITEVASPIVHTMTGGPERGYTYYDATGRRLPFAEVIDSALGGDGMLHTADKTGYKIIGGTVAGFALSGTDKRGPLAHFDFLASYAEFLGLFGEPDLVKERIDTGELMGYFNHYWGSRKMAHWDSWDEKFTFVNLGSFEGNDRPQP